MELKYYPDGALRERAVEVTVFDAALKAELEQMIELMVDRDGIGLAATQVGIAKRMLILDPYAFEGDEARGKPMISFINPEIIEQSEDLERGDEGCLSFPGVFIKVERPRRIKVRAQDPEGAYFEIEGEGLGARALLHEIDHLEGVVMIDHVSFLSRQRALKKHERNLKAMAQAQQRAKRKGKRA
ncbi:peptide deformylase [Myxococcota bacterium]|nr:peptide deformylase [Myxococcota bacterium]MBU1429244.1 peptide deformylase [Myxococcota bacterium]MBU1897989.1 peptide deformylase [Myxococcota bacterium]